MNNDIVPLFLNKIRNISESDYHKLKAYYNNPEIKKTIRVNTSLLSVKEFIQLFDKAIHKVDFLDVPPKESLSGGNDAFYYLGEKAGKHPYYYAGLYYIQESAAMLPVKCLPVCSGWKVLDLCAAPGGKTTQLSNYVGADGIVVANEVVFSRARILQSHVERMALSNTIVTNLDPDKIAEVYNESFDAVLVDAPCSGEGMFSKSTEAIRNWSEKYVSTCAFKQKEILTNAVKALKPGGILVYSTCTFSTEENEEVILYAIRHLKMRLLSAPKYIKEITKNGFELESETELKEVRRVYPYMYFGGGQVFALLSKEADIPDNIKNKNRQNVILGQLNYQDKSSLTEFLREVLEVDDELPVKLVNNNFIIPPKNITCLPPGGVISCGTTVGGKADNRIMPHHHFFKVFGRKFIRKVELSMHDEKLWRYLRGEEFEARGQSDGWGSVLVDGYPLGGVKIKGGIAKNHYPKGLRIL